MKLLPLTDRAELLTEIPDAPSTLEFRALAIDPAASVFRSGHGWLLVDDAKTLLCAAGKVVSEHVGQLYAQLSGRCELLADPVAYETLRGHFDFERAIIRSRAPGWVPPMYPAPPELQIRRLQASDPLAHVPSALRREIEQQLAGDVPIVAGLARGLPVAFAHSGSTTERLADISIDVLAGHRQRGYGRAVTARLIEELTAQGKKPIWGAVADNAASLALGTSLGFTCREPDLFVYEPEEP
jgi:ribosomal protein S18 acetylase RimI-like enzyme